jgi:hypothetical protein
VRLPRREGEAGRVAERVDQGVDLGAQTALAAPDRLARAAFLIAPALCWWARTMVLSIIAHSLSASPAKYCKILAHTPVLAHQPRQAADPSAEQRPASAGRGRLNRVCTLFQSPKRSGRSRQGMPAR